MKAVLCIFLVCFVTNVYAQDFHFSNYDNAALQLNPALTGFIPGGASSRIQATYRDQWVSALGTGSFKTAAASYDHRYCGNFNDGYVSLGLSVFSDFKGENTLSTSGATVSGAYTRKLAGTKRQPTLITLAAEGGITQNALVPRNRTFDAQFDDPNNPGEFFLASSSLTPDLGVGLFISKSIIYRVKRKDFNVNVDAFSFGLAIKHVNRPLFKFLDAGQAESTRLPMRTNAHLSLTKEVGKKSINLLLQYSQHNPFSMLYGRMLMTFTSNQTVRYALGLGLRLNNDLNGINSETGVITGQVRRDKLFLSLSYDANLGPLRNATGGTGAFELSAGWFFGSGSCVDCPVGF